MEEKDICEIIFCLKLNNNNIINNTILCRVGGVPACKYAEA